MKASNISERNWISGPRNDPYQVTEITLQCQNGAYAILRQGMAMKVIMRRKRGRIEREVHMDSPEQIELADALLVRTVGLTHKQLIRVKRKLEQVEYRLHKSHGGYEWVDGYPGEQLCRCACGAFIDYHFSLAAVE